MVLDLVFGCLHDDGPHRVEPGAPGTSGDLMELAGLELTHAGAVEFRQTRQ